MTINKRLMKNRCIAGDGYRGRDDIKAIVHGAV